MPVAIAATFTFIIAWLNKGLVGRGEGRGALLVGVLLAAGTIGIGSLVAEIVS